MTGPTCSVLLKSRLDPDSKDQLDQLLNEAGWQDLETLFVEVSPVDSGADAYEELELRQIEDGFRWRPLEQVVCISMVGQDPDFHRLLSQAWPQHPSASSLSCHSTDPTPKKMILDNHRSINVTVIPNFAV